MASNINSSLTHKIDYSANLRGVLIIEIGGNMIWEEDISFEGFFNKVDKWYKDKEFELCDPPINAQFALDLIFKTLIDDKENYPYLTTMPESTEQTNSIMLDIILTKYSRKYRKLKNNSRRNSIRF